MRDTKGVPGVLPRLKKCESMTEAPQLEFSYMDLPVKDIPGPKLFSPY